MWDFAGTVQLAVCDIFGIVVEILSVPTKDWSKSPVPFPAEIAQGILKLNLNNLNKTCTKKMYPEIIIIIIITKLNHIAGFLFASRTEMV